MMRKVLPFLMITLAMVFAACNPATQASSTPGSGTETMGTEVMSTEPMSTEPESTEATSTEEMATEPVSTEMPATQPASTEVLPPTGESDPGRTSALLDFVVLDQSNEQVGNVADMVFDLGAVRIAYVIVDTSEGGSGDLIAVPFEALSLGASDSSSSEQQNAFVLTVDRDVFDGAPVFDPASIPEAGSDTTGWDDDLKTYWDSYLTAESADTSMSAAGMTGVVLASDVLALSIGSGTADSGLTLKVNDVLIDPDNGDLLYVVVDFSDGAGGQKLIPIPIHLFKWDTTTGTFSLEVTPDDLASAPSFSMDQYPSTLAPNWDAEFNNFWQGY